MSEQRTQPLALAINGGEWSPNLRGQTNLQGYSASAETLENFLPLVQGPITRRGGTRHVAFTAVPDTQRSWLVPFVQRRDITAMLEFSPWKIRVFVNHGMVLSGGVPYEIATPWGGAALQTDQVFFGLSYVQQGNTIYIVNREGTVPPHKLTRHADDDWTLTEVEPSGGPMEDMNASDTTMYVSATAGTGVNVTASDPIFTASDVGRLLRIDFEGSDTLYWNADSNSTGGATYVWSDGKEYEKTGGDSTSGRTAPTHTRGTVSDGRVLWRYRSPGYGILRITSVTSSTIAVGQVLTRFPSALVGATFKSHYFRFGRWGGPTGYPTTVSLFNRRLIYGQGVHLDGSWPDSFDQFDLDDAGIITDECAFSITMGGGLAGDVIEMTELASLVVHTDQGQYLVGPQSSAEPFGPANVRVQRAGNYGSTYVRNVAVGPAAFFIPPGGKTLRAASYDLNSDGLAMPNTMIRADHLTGRAVNADLRDIARQETPYGVLWVRRRDGALLSLTYEQDQDARAWGRHYIAGEGPGGNAYGLVEHIAVIPSPDGLADELWMIVRRRINGVSLRQIEYMTQGYDRDDLDPGDFCYFDAHLRYEGASTTTLAGLDHLEGLTVGVLLNGHAHPDRVVTGGAITLDRPTTLAYVGLRNRCRYKGPKLEQPDQARVTTQGRTKRIARVGLRVLNTLGGSIGGDFDVMDPIPELSNFQPGPMDSPPKLVSRDVEALMPTGWDTDTTIAYENDTGFPVTLVAILPSA